MQVKSFLISLALVLASDQLSAQVLVEPEPLPANQDVTCGQHTNPASKIAELRDHYTAGRWELLQAQTRELLNSCTFFDENIDKHLFVVSTGEGRYRRPNFKRDWYMVVLATVNRQDEPLTVRYLVRDPVPPPYVNATVGVLSEPRDSQESEVCGERTPRLLQVVLAPHSALSVHTTTHVTETPDPVQEQVADFVKAIADPSVVVSLLKGIIAPASGEAAAAAQPEPVRATLARVFPPVSRGDYKYTDVISAPPTLDAEKGVRLRARFEAVVEAATKAAEGARQATSAAVKEEQGLPSAASESERQQAAARRRDAAEAEKLRKSEMVLAKVLGNAASEYVREKERTSCSAAKYDPSCWRGLANLLREKTTEFCVTEETLCKADMDDLVLLKFLEVADPPKTTTASASVTFANTPYQRLSFGAVGAYVVNASLPRDRVKVDGGKLVSDPLGRAMTAVVLNVHPRFNPKAPTMERGERWRGFAGAVLTPNLGLCLGAGYGILRSLSINAGYALLVVPTLRTGDELDAPPSDGRRPLRAGPAHVAFIGLGYKFGK